jgi:hypothetical protein
MERSLGHSFGGVQVHTDHRAAALSGRFGARAFAYGQHIGFGAGQYRPGTLSGDFILAHELAHTVQQRGAAAAAAGTLVIGDAAAERDANRAAAGAVGSPFGVIGPLAPTQRRGLSLSFNGCGGPPANYGITIPKGPEDISGQAFTVDPALLATDKTRKFLDPTDNTVKPVYTEATGYVKNPSAVRLETQVKNGKISGQFENGKFMYAMDENDEIWIGKRLSGPRVEGAEPVTGTPHPTLIGGKNPRVLGAGIVEIRGGKIYRVDNHTGHFKVSQSSLRQVAKRITNLDPDVFHPEFKMESVHVDAQGVETFKRFRSLNLLKLKIQQIDVSKFLGKFKWKAIKGRFNSPKFRSAGKTVAAIIAYLILNYLVSKWMESIEKDLIVKQIGELGPGIQDALDDKAEEFDALLAEDPNGDVYTNVRFAVFTVDLTDTSDPAAPPETVPSLPMVRLIGVGYSRTPWDPTPVEKSFQSACYQGWTHVQSLTLSEKVPVKEVLYEDQEAKPETAKP